MGESVVEGKVSKWLVKEGDAIQMDQPIVEVSTDKVDVEIPAPSAGALIKILVPEGETVSVGTEIALIESGIVSVAPETISPEVKEAPPPSPKRAPAAPPSPATRLEKRPPEEKGEIGRVSPLVKKLAEEYKIDLQKISGTGMGGRITKQDILRYLGKETLEEAAPSQIREAPREAPPKKAPPAAPEFSEYKIPRYEPKEGDQVIPFSRLRKMIAEHMVYSKRTAPHVTTVAEADMMKVVRLREEKKGWVKEQTGRDLTFLPFVVSAAVRAIEAYPTLNASVAEQNLIIRKEIHIGIAVETEKGLMVPVIRHADEKSLIGLSRAAAELAAKAKEGVLRPDDVTGGSFTVSNPGRKGNLFGTPIIFQPQVAILRMGEVIKRAVVVEVEGTDTIAIHPMMYLALSYDHRVIDGATGNLFLHRVKEILEEGRFSF